MGLETRIELFLHLCLLAVFGGHDEEGVYPVIWFTLECLNLAFPFYNQSYGYALHTSGRERRLYFAPEDWRQLEAHKAVEHTAGLLRVYEIHVQVSWIAYGIHDGRLGDFVEHDTAGLLLVQTEHLAQMPRDGFSLAVLIGCEPYLVGFLGTCLQFRNELLLLFGYLIVGFQRIEVDADFLFLQVADMTVA